MATWLYDTHDTIYNYDTSWLISCPFLFPPTHRELLALSDSLLKSPSPLSHGGWEERDGGGRHCLCSGLSLCWRRTTAQVGLVGLVLLPYQAIALGVLDALWHDTDVNHTHTTPTHSVYESCAAYSVIYNTYLPVYTNRCLVRSIILCFWSKLSQYYIHFHSPQVSRHADSCLASGNWPRPLSVNQILC